MKRLYHPYKFCQYYYMVLGRSNVLLAVDGVILADKDSKKIQAVADILNDVVVGNRSRYQSELNNAVYRCVSHLEIALAEFDALEMIVTTEENEVKS